jgi:methanogenic corrinoid protein MtbC1
VIDLGVGVGPESFVAAVKQHQPQILGLSALLTTTMSAMQTTIAALEQAGVRNELKVLVGGAPITHDFAREIGADGTSNSGTGAVCLAKLALNLPATAGPGVHLCGN